jgi:hypothetical protein
MSSMQERLREEWDRMNVVYVLACSEEDDCLSYELYENLIWMLFKCRTIYDEMVWNNNLNLIIYLKMM